MRASSIKTTYLRAGTYALTSGITFTSADDGVKISYYLPDGYNSAILDRGIHAMAASASNWVFTINGGSNITIDGLTIQNFGAWAIGIHGGAIDSAGGGAAFSATGTAANDTIINNIIQNGYTATSTVNADSGWAGGGIHASGSTANLHILNNVVINQYGNGIRAVPTDAGGGYPNPASNQNGLTISNNVVLATNQGIGDGGAIYVQDLNFNSTGITISNNFIRDYQADPALRNSTVPARDVAIYLDEGACNVTVTGNIIAATANAISDPGPLNPSTMAFYSSSGHNNLWSGNIVDLGTAGVIQDFDYEFFSGSGAPAMTDNTFTGNIFIGNWSGAQRGYGSGSGPTGFGGGGPVNPTVAHNMYYNYGGGSLSTTGPLFRDVSPITGSNPLISGATYKIGGGSPAVDSPVDFPSIAGDWGPPGYVIPATGTPPSP